MEKTLAVLLAVIVPIVAYFCLRDSAPAPSPTTPAVTTAPSALSPVAALIDGKLVSANGTDVPTPGPAVKYFAVYYSAHWCPPCRAFSPDLVTWYNQFKPTHPNFELVFVSEDNDAGAMAKYMTELAMPWPAVKYSELQHGGDGGFKGPGIEKFAGSGIPDLVFVGADGTVLADSFDQDGTYLGPRQVLDAIERLVPAPGGGQAGNAKPSLPELSAGR